MFFKNTIIIDVPGYKSLNISGEYEYWDEHQTHPVWARKDDSRHVIYWTANNYFGWAHQWCIGYMPWVTHDSEATMNYWPDDRAYAFIFSDDPMPPSGAWFIWDKRIDEWVYPLPYVEVIQPVTTT